MYYYSLKTEKEEHCLEPRIFGGYDYGIYDLNQNLLKKKVVVKKEDAVEFIYKTQKKLGGTFIKMDMSGDSPKAVGEMPQEKPKEESTFEKNIKEELKSMGATTAMKEEKTINLGNGEVIHQQNHVIKREKVSDEEFEKNKDKYRLIAELNHITGMVSIEVQSVPHENAQVTCDRGMEIIDKLLRAVVQTFPELVDNYFISAGVKQTGESYEDFSSEYKKSSTIPVKARSRCLTALKKAVDTYKEQIS
jgi:transcription antitermination factor NusG